MRNNKPRATKERTKKRGEQENLLFTGMAGTLQKNGGCYARAMAKVMLGTIAGVMFWAMVDGMTGAMGTS
jgi:hypothetical protein